MLSVLVIHEQISNERELLVHLLGENLSLTFTKNTEDALKILGADHHLHDAVIIQADLAVATPDFLKNILLHHAYKTLPVITFGPNLAELPGFIACPSSEHLPSIIDMITHYAESKPRNRYHCGHMTRGEFYIKTLAEAHILSKLLSNQYPQPEKMLIGVSELLINAVEHGNLGITFDEKSALLATNSWFDEIDKRLQNEVYRHRKASILFERTETMIKLTIQDEGDGFNWQQYETFNPRRMLAQHGRGIMMAKAMAFSRLNYNEKGNCVYTELDL